MALRPRFSLRTLVVFTLLVTAGMGLWWRRDAWILFASLGVRAKSSSGPGSGIYRVVFTGDGERVAVLSREKGGRRWYREWHPSTGRCVVEYQLPPAGPNPRVVLPFSWDVFVRDGTRPPQGDRVLAACERWHDPEEGNVTELPQGPRIKDSVTKQTLFVFYEEYDWADNQFSPDGERVLIARNIGRGGQSAVPVYVYRRRRPEWWWGVFYLWEFWLTAALGALFIWSVWRDRRALRPNAERRPGP